MSVLEGHYYDGKRALRHTVSVLLAGGRLRVVGRDVDGDFDAKKVRVSPRIASTPRWLYLPDGGACVIADNDFVDRVTRVRPFANTLHKWESRPAYAALAAQPNVHVVLYEALCAWPETMSRRMLAFAGLDWTRQTEAFVARSSAHPGAAGYYAIYRNTTSVAEAWKTSMPPADQDAVRSVMAASPLARFWPDLMSAAASLRGQ